MVGTHSKLALSLVLACLAMPLAAQTTTVKSDSARITDRIDLWDADEVVITRHGDVALLIVGDDLVIQLTEAGLSSLGEDSRDEEDGLGQRILEAMMLAGVRELLDHGIAYPIDRVQRAVVVGGRLVIEGEEGDEVFGVTMHDRDVMDDFEARDARAMARAIRARM